jgi:hypothetical protein
MSSRPGLRRSYSNDSNDRVDPGNYLDNGQDESYSRSRVRKSTIRRSISGPSRYERRVVHAVAEDTDAAPTDPSGAKHNVELSVSQAGKEYEFHEPKASLHIDRIKLRKESKLRSQNRRHRRELSGSFNSDDSGRSVRASLSASDEEWAMFKEALAAFA